MQRFILFRFLQSVVTLLVVTLVVFALTRASGDPMHLLLSLESTPEDYARVRASLGLDQPLYSQYFIYLNSVFHGDLGLSLRTKMPVVEILAQRLPYSISLALASITFTVLLAIPLGIVAAVRKNTKIDIVAKVIALLGQAMPIFWLGIVLMLIFGVYLHWLPTSGIGTPLHYILPAFTMGWFVAAGVMRLMRSSMLDTLDSEYVKLARIKGVSESRVIWIHSLRNALIPVVTFAGIYFALFIGAAVVVETVFNWPGLGRLAYESVLWRDFPVIQGVILIIAALVMVVNLAVDILYAYIDPRIRY